LDRVAFADAKDAFLFPEAFEDFWSLDAADRSRLFGGNIIIIAFLASAPVRHL
jgi:hypothetical protein